MKRIRGFAGYTAALLAMMGTAFYFLGKPDPGATTDAAISRKKAERFCVEATRLDSLYKAYSALSTTIDPVLLASIKANLDRQLALMKADFARSGTPPAQLATKLIRNYEFRLLLVDELRNKQQIQGAEISRLNQQIRQQEAMNLELKTRNQMVEQVLLSLP